MLAQKCNVLMLAAAFVNPGFHDNTENDNSMTTCLKRAFAHLKLFCFSNSFQVYGIRNFTVQNLHAVRNAFPYVGCKGADTVVILKWLVFFASLQLQQQGWSAENKQLLSWIITGAKGGLSFGQGIHGHGIWLAPSCQRHLQRAVQKFGNAYAHLAHYSLRKGYSLFGMVPKLHALMHFRTEFKEGLQEKRKYKLNPACFDNSMSEDFIGRISRQSRRIPARKMEWTILRSYKVKAKFVIQKFCKQHRLQCGKL